MKARSQGRQGGTRKQVPAQSSCSGDPPAIEQSAPRAGLSSGWFAYPGLCLLAGAGLCGFLARTGTAAAELLTRLGLSPGPLGALGLALLAVAALHAVQNRSQARLGRLEQAIDQIAHDNTVIRTNLADLGSIDVAAKLAQVAGGLAPTEIKDALDKADEKLNNLTRAIRMFSQPLQDVSQASEELRADTARLQESFKELATSVETLLIRLEDLSASLPGRTGRELEERLSESLPELLSEALAPVQESLAAQDAGLQERLGAALHPLQEALRDLCASKPDPAEEEPLAGELKTLSGRLEALFSSLGERLAPAPDLRSLETRLCAQIDQAIQRIGGLAPPPAPAMATAPAAQAPPPPPAPVPAAPAKGNVAVLSAIQKLKQLKGRAST